MKNKQHYSVCLGERGRLVLPAALHRQLDLRPGDRLIIRVSDMGEVNIVSARELAHRGRGIFRDVAPGRSLVEELIAERREEARREDAGE